MKFIIILLFLFIQVIQCKGQSIYYNVISENIVEKYRNNPNLGYRVYSKYQRNKLCILRMSNNDSNNNNIDVEYNLYNLDNNIMYQNGSFQIEGVSTFILDFVFNDSNISVLLPENTFYTFGIINNKIQKKELIEIEANNIFIINEDKILFYRLYPSHPYDSKNGSKLVLYGYDVKKNIVDNKLVIDFEGISLCNINNRWLRVINDTVYLIYPLTGVILKFDNSLNKIDEFQIGIPELQSDYNLKFVNSMDQRKQIADNELIKFKELKGEEYINNNKIISEYYTKDALMKRIDTLRNNYVYIEKIIEINDTIMGITLSRPGYEQQYRDLYLIKKENGQIIRSFSKWRCAKLHQDSIVNQIEDYYTIDLINSNLYEGHFYKNNFYSTSYSPTSLFVKGIKRKEIDKIIFKWLKENSNSVYIIKYNFMF